LGDNRHFGQGWFAFDAAKQDAIVLQLVREENEAKLVRWLQEETGIDEARAEAIANAGLPEGYGSLCSKALARILPELRRKVVTYDKAVIAAGFDHHSNISPSATGEILSELPYYGIALQRHVAFGSVKPEDSEEKRYGKIANPTVHIGLNQVRLVVNALIKRYGHPSEVIVELARDLKQSKEQRDEDNKRQAENQRRNARMRADIAGVLNTSPERVRAADIQKMILWEELSNDPADRRCPYSGEQISATMLLSEQVEIEHILPFSETLDDSLNNKTVAKRQANRIKGNRTPWQAREDFAAQGWSYDGIVERAKQIPNKAKRDRFAEDGLQRWLKEDKSFLARALNDTRHLSKVAREYLSLVCPQNTRVIPGRMTAMLRAKFGLNDVLGLNGEKNRNDHRHHAVDACVIAVTDQALLQRFSQASASAREQHLNRIVEDMPLPWDSYRDSVQRAIDSIWVSHKPDHGHEGAMHEETAWGLLPGGLATRRTRGEDGKRQRETKTRTVIPFGSTNDPQRHGLDAMGMPKAYKGYVGGSNYCMDIVCNDKGKWEGEPVSTFAAYQLVRSLGNEAGLKRLRSRTLSISGKALVMRLQNGDLVRMQVDGKIQTLRVVKMKSNGQMVFAPHNEANVDARNTSKDDAFAYVSKTAGSLQNAQGRRITVSPIGELKDPGFKE
jgi:CRISPR-associated endonuclease Csn1